MGIFKVFCMIPRNYMAAISGTSETLAGTLRCDVIFLCKRSDRHWVGIRGSVGSNQSFSR